MQRCTIPAAKLGAPPRPGALRSPAVRPVRRRNIAAPVHATADTPAAAATAPAAAAAAGGSDGADEPQWFSVEMTVRDYELDQVGARVHCVDRLHQQQEAMTAARWAGAKRSWPAQYHLSPVHQLRCTVALSLCLPPPLMVQFNVVNNAGA